MILGVVNVMMMVMMMMMMMMMMMSKILEASYIRPLVQYAKENPLEIISLNITVLCLEFK